MTLIAAYDFDEGTGTTVADASGNGNTGTISNATWIVADKSFGKFNGAVDNASSKPAGKYGSALVFNGTSALVTIPNSSSLQLTTGMTLEAWVNPSAVGNAWRDVIYKADDNFYLEATSMTSGTPPAGGGIFGSSNVFTAGMSALPTNTWTHLAATYDGVTLKLYINGTQVSSRSQTGNILTSTNPLQIGGDSLYGQYFQGMIDEVRIYDVALTQAQIQTDMNTPIGYVPPPDTTPPTAPTNLTATAISASEIDLAWTASTDNVGVTGYLIEREDPGSSSFSQIGTSSGTTFGDTNLTASSTYSYRVRATDGASNLSSYSSTASATAPSSGTVTTYTMTGPSSGEVATASSNFTVTLGTGTVSGTIHISFAASNSDGTFSPTVLNLTNTTRSGTFTYTPNLWGTRTISSTNNGGLTNPSPLSYVSKVQLGSSGTAPTYTRSLNLGGFSFFTNGGWWQELGRTVTGDSVASNSADLLAPMGSGTIRINFWTSTNNNGNSFYGMPFNVVPGNQSLLSLTLGDYANESDPGPVPFFSNMTIENWYSSSGVPPTQTQMLADGLDHHAQVMLRNETTGGIDQLYEYYQVYSNDGGTTWGATGGATFNLVTGDPRPEGWTSSDAGGMAVSPLEVFYDEAASGSINHPLRLSIGGGVSRNNFVWPARHTVYSGSSTTGLPMGARLRLSQSWYNANINSFSSINRTIVTALRNYGGIVADLDGGGIWIMGVNDSRWDVDDVLDLQRIPVSAFEVLDTIKSPLSFTGPTSGTHGVAQSYTVEYLIAGNSNFSANIYLENSTDGGANWNLGNSATFDDTHRGPTTLTFTPPSAGTYLMRLVSSGPEWIMPSPITLIAS